MKLLSNLHTFYLTGIICLMVLSQGFATQYRFIGDLKPEYTYTPNWDTTGIYGGYPGLFIGINDTVITERLCRIPETAQFVVEGTIIMRYFIYNNGDFDFNGTLINDSFAIVINRGNFIASAGLINNVKLVNEDSMTIEPGVVLEDLNMENHEGFLKINNSNNTGLKIWNYSYGGTGIIQGAFSAQRFDNRTGSIYLSGDGPRTRVINELYNIGDFYFNIAGENESDLIINSVTSFYKFSGKIIVRFTNNYIPQDYAEFKILEGPPGYDFDDCLEIVSPDPSIHWEIRQETNGDVFLIAFPKSSPSLDNMLDFGTTDIDTNSYVYFNTNIGLIRTIEFKIFPQVIDLSETAGMLFNFGTSGLKYIFQGNGFSAIPGETLSILNGGLLYIDNPLQHRCHHITLCDGDSDGFYDEVFIDGELVDVYTDPGRSSALPACFYLDDFQIGARIGTPYAELNFRGRMDEVRLWSVSRKPEQIMDNWNIPLNISDTIGLEAYYTMNQGNSHKQNTCPQSVFDFSGNENHGNFQRFRFKGNHLNWVETASCPDYVLKQNNTFVGQNTDWFDPDNWSLNQIPSSCHHVIIPMGKTVVVSQLGAHCYTLEVQGSINTESVYTMEVWAPKSE